jgi:SPP1 gp7 family putative phage head morphogenesis protein
VLQRVQEKNTRLFGYDDRSDFSPRSWFIRTRKAETFFATKLRKIGRHIGDIVSAFDPADPAGQAQMQTMLEKYAQTLGPWATAVTSRMHADVAARDRDAWKKAAAQMGTALHREIDTAPTGQALWRLLNEQTHLITSLPIEAAQRVQMLAVKGLQEGTRPKEIAEEIMRSGEVSKARATMIARTETARTASVLTQVRAQHIGSTHFVWETARDGNVRPNHRRLQGKVFAWNDPPECDPPHRALPGQIWNCRCFASPVIPSD